MKESIIAKIKNSPKEPGVYIFYTNKTPIYVGKAANLRARLKSYLKITDYKTEALQNETTSLEPIVLRSEIEALIEESRLIKELKPRYNVLQRDDKSYSYVYFTKETFPKVFITHARPKRYALITKSPPAGKQGYSRIGPFTDSGSLRTALNTIRRYFPYCACFRPHLRDCLNAQIEKCLGFCCKKIDSSVIAIRKLAEKQSYDNIGKIAASSRYSGTSRDDEKAKYAKNIRAIKAILRGQSQKLFPPKEDPPRAEKTPISEYEKAALEKIFEHQPYLNLRNESERSNRNPAAGGLGGFSKLTERSDTKTPPSRGQGNFSPEKISGLRESVRRVECFDNSHLTGKEAVGALTALVKINGAWQSDKNSYRKFKIKSADTQDDPRMMYEIVSRRLNHPEWPLPDLMIIDGGITQYRAAKQALEKAFSGQRLAFSEKNNSDPKCYTLYPKLISFAKPQKLVYGLKDNDETTPLAELDKELRQVIEHAIYQTHNFVIRYHRNVRNREFLPKK